MFLVPFFRGLARHLHLACLALTATTATVLAQTAADGFDPNVDGNIYAMARQGDGKIIIVGDFKNIAPNGGIMVPRTYIARINPDGSFDDFAPAVDGPIRAVAIVGSQNDILIAGDFSKVGGDTATHQGIARLKSNGTVDTTFKASIGPATSGVTLTPRVFAMAVEGDGHLVLGGSFGSATWVDVNGQTQTAARNNVARFDASGRLDTNYNPNANGMVLAAAYQTTSGKVIIGGGFTQLNSPEATTRLHAARLNPDGTVDSEWDPKPNDGVTAIAVQKDGKVVLGGYFTTVQPRGSDSAQTRTHIARLNADDQGTIDTEFYPVVGGTVLGIGIADDGSLLVGGHFSQVWGRGTDAVAAAYVARFASDGTIDSSFYPGVNADVAAFAFQPDGDVILGGYFTRATPSGSATAIVRNHMARVLPSGALDAAFQVNAGGRILTSVTVSDGIIVAGTFTNIGGVTRNYIAKLKSDGSVDPNYAPNANAPIYAMAYDSKNNKVVVGGAFTAFGSSTSSSGISTRNYLARLNADGTVDSEFNPNLNGAVGCIAIQSDGNIVVGGTFTALQPFGTTDVVTRAYLVRLTSAGQVDTGFDPSPNASVTAMAIQSDGKIIIGGSFSTLQPGATGTITTRNSLARLNTDGTIDTKYNPTAYSAATATAYIAAIVVQPSDGKAVIGGSFTHFLPDGATAWVERHNLVRLNTDGTVDTAFYDDPNAMVLALAIQPDNKILVGGAFTIFQPNGGAAWTQDRYVGRLNADGTVDTSFNLDMPESPGQRVDSLSISNGNILVGGTFTLLYAGSSRISRNHFAMVSTTGAVQSFDPGAGGAPTGTVNSIAVQPDGKLVVVGKFTDLGGAASTNIARFNPEGVPDGAFNNVLNTSAATGQNNEVKAVAIRANGSVAPTQLAGFAWLQNDGTLRTSFKPLPDDIQNPGSTDIRLEGQVLASAFQSNGQLILAGSFSDLTNNSKGNIVRLNSSTGKLDTSFSVELNGSVLAMAVYPSDSSLADSIIIAGNFTTVNGTTRNHIARLNADGSLDTAFDPSANGAVNAVVIQKDGQVILGGSFTSLTPNSATSSTTRNYLARVKSDGTLDTTTVYDPNLNGTVNALALDSQNRLIVGGAFTTLQPNSATSSTLRSYLARLNSDGSVDTNFVPNPNNAVMALAIQSDGQIMIGGSFTLIQPVLNGNQAALTEHHFIARISDVDGNVDGQFTAGTNATVTSLSLGANDTLVIGGYFTTVYETGSTSANAVARNHIARFKGRLDDQNVVGILDTSFNPDVAGVVSYVSVLQSVKNVSQSDGTVLVGGSFNSLQSTGVILVGGSFTGIGGQQQSNLAQINGDGSINASFKPNPDGVVNALLPLSDGSFLVGGAFTTIAGQPRSGLARFNSTGSLNANFVTTGLSGSVTALAVQADGNVLVGTSSGLVRLDGTSGKLDTSFSAGAPFLGVAAIAIQADGRIIVAGPGSGVPSRIMRLNASGSVDGSFSTVSLSSGTDVRALQLQIDGSILVAGSFTNIGSSGINYLARLTSVGGVDPKFNPAPNGVVSAFALQSDGRLMIGGAFTTVGNLQRYSLARVTNTSTASETVGPLTDNSTLTFITSGTAGEISGVTFEVSKDAQTWVAADGNTGVGTRVAGTTTWQIKNATAFTNIAGNTVVYVRARAITPSAGKSAGVYEIVSQINPSGSLASAATTVGAVQSSVSWDSTHYVWTVDGNGVLHIVDAYSSAVLSSAQSILIDGSGTSTGSSAARVADLSTRGTVTPASPLEGGFAIVGSAARQVLIRAVGPGLAPFNVTNYLKTPKMVLFNSAGTVLSTVSGWNSALKSDFARTGAFPLTEGSTDCALVVTLNPGTYTVHVIDGDGAASPGGDALVEIYDAGDISDTGSRITNLSSRGTVSTNGTLIGGLYISGTASKTVLVRASGPALTKFSVSDVLADPSVTIYDSAGNPILTNDNWQTSSSSLVSDLNYATAISSAATTVGAFPFDSGSKDAALVITLPPGAYSVMVNGVNGTTGSALLEVYELP